MSGATWWLKSPEQGESIESSHVKNGGRRWLGLSLPWAAVKEEEKKRNKKEKKRKRKRERERRGESIG